MYAQALATPIGRLLVCSDGSAVTGIVFSAAPPPGLPDDLTRLACRQLAAYFAGTRQAFSFPIRLDGADFARAVYRALLQVPYGQTVSYGSLAIAAGHPGAARAVGTVMRKNRLVIVVPCHRVLAARGLGGYSCGLDKKRWLLAHERAVFSG